MNNFKKHMRNNWILYSLTGVNLCLLIVISVLVYFYNYEILNFIKEWQTFFIPFFFIVFYSLFFCCYIFYEKRRRKKWQQKKDNELKKLYLNNEKDDFINYNNLLEKINNEISTFFDYQDKQNYITHILLLKGKYGCGKTFLTTNFLKKIEEKKEIKIYYIDLSIIENQSRSNFPKYLFNEIIKCIDYDEYLRKLFNLKFFKIFAKNLPFDFANEEIFIKSENKILIVIDEIDRCEPDNIISTLTILKNYFLHIKNVVIILLLNEEVIKPIIQDYYKMSENKNVLYELFFEKITNTVINIENFSNFEFQELEFLKGNKIIQNSKYETNNFVKNNLKSNNQRKILGNINDKALAQKIKAIDFLLRNKNKDDLFELLQFLSLFKILLNKIPKKIVETTFSKNLFETNYTFNFSNHLKFQQLINIDYYKIYKLSNDNMEFTLSEKYAFSLLTIDYKDNLYASTFNSSKIYKISKSGKVQEFVDLGVGYICSLTIDYKDNLYASTFNSSKIYKISKSGKVEEFVDLGVGYICSLTIDYKDNLYASIFNSSKIYKIGEWRRVEEFVDLGKTSVDINLANKIFREYLFFSKKNSSSVYYLSIYDKNVYTYASFPIIVKKQLLYVNEEKGLYSLVLDKNKIYHFSNHGYNNEEISVNLEDSTILSLTGDHQNNLYMLTLDNKVYDIKYDFEGNYCYSFSKKFIEQLFNKSYSSYFIFKNKMIKKMNFLDFYFIKNKLDFFTLIYINLKSEYKKNEEIKIIRNTFEKIHCLISELETKNITLIVEYDENKYKIIFDLSKNKLINFVNYEDIWWKLSEIKDNNKILQNYNSTIHDCIVDLLNNVNWKENIKIITSQLKNK